MCEYHPAAVFQTKDFPIVAVYRTKDIRIAKCEFPLLCMRVTKKER